MRSGAPGGLAVRPSAPAVERTVLLVLFFASGAAALVYQVLWVREIGLLVGSTAQAAAITIAIFFAGIASGGWWWGRRAPVAPSALRTFGRLEVGVALTALGYFVLADTYRAAYPSIHGALAASWLAEAFVVGAIAAAVLFPASFLMGGTLPAMGQHLVRSDDQLATTGTLLYAVNTAGSATGALAAGFVLPVWIGFRTTYLLAVAVDLAVGATALALARRHASASTTRQPAVQQAASVADVDPVASRGATSISRRVVAIVAAASGFATLAIEVVWTRLFAQVLQNSAQTYATVLATFLLALAVGGLVANAASRLRRVDPTTVLAALLLAGGAAVTASLWLFHHLTDGLSRVGGDQDWGPYLATVAGTAALTIGVPVAVLGAVLPYLLRVVQGGGRTPGEEIGRLVAVNTAGAIGGALAGGFVILPALGAWRGMLHLAAVYPALAVLVLAARTRELWSLQRSWRRTPALLGASASVVVLLALPAAEVTATSTVRPGERLVELREGPDANVAVVRDVRRDLAIRVNASYTLGGTRGLSAERNQAVIPLLVHPEARSVFFLGLGTGITAGAALAFPVERVVVCELIRDVVDLSRDHFGPWINGLFGDPRAEVTVADGRSCLHRSQERFDLIISDLFVPWHAGAAALYTREHYQRSLDRLEPGGAFVQWLPLYQLSERELGIIARTMDDVFDQVVAWRGDVSAGRSALALVGHRDPAPLDVAAIAPAARSIEPPAADGLEELTDEALAAMVLRLYAGNISHSGVFADRARNTDSHPRIEHLTPRTHRAVRAGRASFVVGAERQRLYRELAEALDPARDPYLARLDQVQLGWVSAGLAYTEHRVADARRQDAAAEEHLDRARRLSPPGSLRALSPANVLLPRDLSG
jgi:spermidine synthase